MAKPKQPVLVPMVNGTPWFTYRDRQYRPGEVVMMDTRDAADALALRQVREPESDEKPS